MAEINGASITNSDSHLVQGAATYSPWSQVFGSMLAEEGFGSIQAGRSCPGAGRLRTALTPEPRGTGGELGHGEKQQQGKDAVDVAAGWELACLRPKPTCLGPWLRKVADC